MLQVQFLSKKSAISGFPFQECILLKNTQKNLSKLFLDKIWTLRTLHLSFNLVKVFANYLSLVNTSTLRT